MNLRSLVPELVHYKLTGAYLVLQFALLWHWGRSRAQRRSRVPRPQTDLTWFLPTFVWGIESVLHAHWWIWVAPFSGFAKPPSALMERGLLSASVLAVALAACFVAERWAQRNRCACREPSLTLPLPLLPALFCVQATWILLLLVYFPVW